MNFKDNKSLSKYAEPRVGLQTGDNDRFLRLWYEVPLNRVGYGFSENEEAIKSRKKWFPTTKGGSFRKWYGNNEYVVNWENDGYEIKNCKNTIGKLKSSPRIYLLFLKD